MKVSSEIGISSQAELIIRNTGIDRNKLIKWFTDVRRIMIGGGDVLDYLRYKEQQEEIRKQELLKQQELIKQAEVKKE